MSLLPVAVLNPPPLWRNKGFRQFFQVLSQLYLQACIFHVAIGVLLHLALLNSPAIFRLTLSMVCILFRLEMIPERVLPKLVLMRFLYFLRISRKLGHCPLQTLWDTRKVITGLECLADSHFPRNYVSGDVRVGKSTKSDQPPATMTVSTRPKEI